MMYQTVIGLEVHTQLKTRSKIFCACPANVDAAAANTNICPVCCGYPGVLPVFNVQALKLGIRVALALHCKVQDVIYFERKSYFYPDLPKNYQISQFKEPLGTGGYVELSSGKKIGITRVHLEEDAGKLMHKDGYSLVDLNRTGTPLLEIVSEPDIANPREAEEYLTYLKLLLQYSKASECDMEKGTLRCDANISLKKPQDEKLGVKVELKNMNSFKGVREGLLYEEIRQRDVLDSGQSIAQETRLWDEARQRTQVMRTKEEAHDYRYFPEPDLLDFKVPKEFIEEQKTSIGEEPLQRKRRYMADYQLGAKEADVFVADVWLAAYFEAACAAYAVPEKIAGWLLGPFLEKANELGYDAIGMQPHTFAKIVRLFCEGVLNNITAKKILSACIETNGDVDALIASQGLTQVSDAGQLHAWALEAVAQGQAAVTQYRAGKEQALMSLVGYIMKKSQGKANPKIARQLIEEIISKNV